MSIARFVIMFDFGGLDWLCLYLISSGINLFGNFKVIIGNNQDTLLDKLFKKYIYNLLKS